MCKNFLAAYSSAKIIKNQTSFSRVVITNVLPFFMNHSLEQHGAGRDDRLKIRSHRREWCSGLVQFSSVATMWTCLYSERRRAHVACPRCSNWTPRETVQNTVARGTTWTHTHTHAQISSVWLSTVKLRRDARQMGSFCHRRLVEPYEISDVYGWVTTKTNVCLRNPIACQWSDSLFL